jgi:protein SDA1
MLFQHHANLSGELREKLIQCLLLLQKKGVISPTKLVETLLPLLTATPSKALRMLIFKTTLTTLKDANKQKHKPTSLNRTVETLLFSFVENRPLQGISNLGSTSSTPPGVWAVRITSEMWRRGIWNGARSVELMREAACLDTPRVALGGVQFFLGTDKDDEKDSDSDDDIPDVKRLQHGQQVGKKSKSKDRQIAAAKALLKKVLYPF